MSSQPQDKKPARIRLIPWDHDSPHHANRLYDQRRACGWQFDLIEEWKEAQETGTRALYWVVLADTHPAKDTLLESHVTRFPNEASLLQDTASRLLAAPRDPSRQDFIPIGHVAIELRPKRNEMIGLPRDGVCWVKSFYISWAVQNGGIGRATMTMIESIMTQEQHLNATISVLDTAPEAWQLSYYKDTPSLAPAISNEVWYKRQGYKVFLMEPEGATEKTTDGKTVIVPLLIFKKTLV